MQRLSDLVTLPRECSDTLLGSTTLHAVDAIAALHAASQTQDGRTLLSGQWRREHAADPAAENAAGMAAAIRFTEIDSIHLPSCVTPAAVAVPVALAFASDGIGFARSIEAGFRTGIAIGTAVGGAEALQRGIWPTLLAAPAIAAASACTAFNLDQRQTASALALASADHAGTVAHGDRPLARWVAIGHATLKGSAAAQAARDGTAGSAAFSLSQWLESLGASAVRGGLPDFDEGGAAGATGIKPFACSRQAANAVVALKDLMQGGLTANLVDQVHVRLPPVTMSVAARPFSPAERLSRIANARFLLALVACGKDWEFDLDRSGLTTPDVLRMVEKVTITSDSDLDDGSSGSWPAEVHISGEHVDSRTMRARIPGDAGEPETAVALLQEKLRRMCSRDMASDLARVLKVGAFDDEALARWPGWAASLRQSCRLDETDSEAPAGHGTEPVDRETLQPRAGALAR